MAQSAPATAQTIEAYVGETMDAARMGPIHWQVLALVASGLFFDVLDFTIFGALVPDLIKSGFVTQAQVPWIGSVTVAGLFVGTIGQGEFTDRFGRKAVYQFNLLLFGLATIVAALPPIPAIGFDPGFWWVLVFRFLAGIGLGAEQPLCFSYTAEYAPKNIRGRIIALMQFIGGAWPWPVGVLLTIGFRDTIGWRGIWLIIGIAALVVFVFRFSLPESPRWLATHGQGGRALDLLRRMGLRAPPIETLRTDAASDTKSDPIGIVFRHYPRRVIAGMICFYAFFSIAIGLGMIFFTQLSGNSSQIFISEVFPTNARATGFGLAQAAGRAGAAIAILAIPLIQNTWSTGAVFVAIAVIVAIAAIAVTQVGPEARGLALDEVAPPTA